MPTRETPFGAYNFLVEFDGNEASNSALGGISDVSGLGAEITLMEYRQGNDRENRVRKIPALHKAYVTMGVLTVLSSLVFWNLRNNDGDNVSNRHESPEPTEPA